MTVDPKTVKISFAARKTGIPLPLLREAAASKAAEIDGWFDPTEAMEAPGEYYELHPISVLSAKPNGSAVEKIDLYLCISPGVTPNILTKMEGDELHRETGYATGVPGQVRNRTP